MKAKIFLTVGRPLVNRERNERDDSDLAWEEHWKRSQVLHEVLENDPDWTVDSDSWEEADDKNRTHEDVTVILELAEAAQTIALGFAGTVLYRVLEDTVVSALKKLIKKLVPRQRKREVKRVYAKLPDGMILEWASPAYDESKDVDIWLRTKVSLTMEELDRE